MAGPERYKGRVWLGFFAAALSTSQRSTSWHTQNHQTPLNSPRLTTRMTTRNGENSQLQLFPWRVDKGESGYLCCLPLLSSPEGKNVNLVLTFHSPTNDKLSIEQNPVAWFVFSHSFPVFQVIALQEGYHYALGPRWVYKLKFFKLCLTACRLHCN